jgi:hypothetical protein
VAAPPARFLRKTLRMDSVVEMEERRWIVGGMSPIGSALRVW